ERVLGTLGQHRQLPLVPVGERYDHAVRCQPGQAVQRVGGKARLGLLAVGDDGGAGLLHAPDRVGHGPVLRGEQLRLVGLAGLVRPHRGEQFGRAGDASDGFGGNRHDPDLSQWPRNASSSHHDPCAEVTLASMSSGRSRGPASQSLAADRSPALRTVIPARPNPRPIAAMSAAGNRTVSSGSPSGPKWCTSAPYASSSYTTTTIGSPSRATVSSSLAPISAPPSPSAATASRSGRATAAPTADASPSPTDWNP